MSHYTNPAFCQQSEFYPRAKKPQSTKPKQFHTEVQRSESIRTISRNASQNNQQRLPTQFELQSIRFKNSSKIQQRELPPKPGPKPIQFEINGKELTSSAASWTTKPVTSEGYALVPLDELPKASKSRYAILGSQEANMLCNSSMRLTKSQDDLDRISNSTAEFAYDEGGDSFTSLPAFTQDDRKIVSAFSTDFINKSMILLDQNNMQRYAIVPTEDDEEMVDSSHEIIQIHNGRAHRYAVIPTDDDETCFSGDFETLAEPKMYQAIKPDHAVSAAFTTPTKSKQNYIATPVNAFSSSKRIKMDSPATKSHSSLQRNESMQKLPETPTRNAIATQKLHELLSTPRKNSPTILQRHGSYQTIVHKLPSKRYQSEMLNQSQLILNQSAISRKAPSFAPQKLQYDARQTQPEQSTMDQRTTAIISPRLQQSIYNETTSSNSTEQPWPHESYLKVENATATIGIVSLMLILTGVLNSGLCLYMVTDVSQDMYIKKYCSTISFAFVSILYPDEAIIFSRSGHY